MAGQLMLQEDGSPPCEDGSPSRRTAHAAVVRVALALPAAAYLALIARFAVDVPVGDDYSSILPFLSDHVSAAGSRGTIAALLAPHNAHRITMTRLGALACYELFGAVDFRWLLLSAGLAMVVAAALLARNVAGARPWLAATVLLVVLQPQPDKLMFYPMAALSSYCGILLSLVYVESIARRRHLAIVSLAYLGAVLSNGAGLFLALVGVAALVHQRRLRAAAAHAVLAVVTAALYLPGVGADRDRGSDLAYALEHPALIARHFISTVGGFAEVPFLGASAMTLQAAGAALLASIVYLAYRRADRAHPAACYVVAYLLLNLALISLGRSQVYAGQFARMALDGRYQIYSLLLFATVLAIALARLSESTPTPALARVAVAAAILFCFTSSASEWHQLEARSQQRRAVLRRWLEMPGDTHLPSWAVPPATADAELRRAIESGVYRPPPSQPAGTPAGGATHREP